MHVLVSILWLMACSGGAPEPPPASVPAQPTALTPMEAEVSDLAQVLGEVQVLDVRRREDSQRVRIPGSISIPLASVDPREEPISSWDRARAVYVVDAHGEHAQDAARLLASAGYQAYAVEGGMEAWAGAGLPVEGQGISLAP